MSRFDARALNIYVLAHPKNDQFIINILPFGFDSNTRYPRCESAFEKYHNQVFLAAMVRNGAENDPAVHASKIAGSHFSHKKMPKTQKFPLKSKS